MAEFQNIRISEQEDGRISEYQNFRISECENSRILEYQSIVMCELQNSEDRGYWCRTNGGRHRTNLCDGEI